MTATKMVEVYKKVTGRSEERFIIVSKNQGAGDGSLLAVGSADQLHAHLEQLQNDGKMPVIVQVHTGNKVFRKITAAADASSGEGGWHVVRIRQYLPHEDPTKRIAIIDSNWSWAKDAQINNVVVPEHGNARGVQVQDLFDSMQAPKAPAS